MIEPSPTNAPPLPTATLTRDQQLASLDGAWGKQDWADAVAIVTALRSAFPDDPVIREKHLVAHVNAGDAAVHLGDVDGAARLYSIAGPETIVIERLAELPREALLKQLDATWERDWPGAVKVVTALKAALPKDALVAEKYVATHINAGDWAATRGDSREAARLYAAAGGDPVALARLNALTPDATSAAVAARPKARGLGVSRRAVQAAFEQPQVGFTFEEVVPVDGEPRFSGRGPDGSARIELIGPAEDLTSASVVSGIPAQSPTRAALGATYMLGLLKLVTPEWTNAADWLSVYVGGGRRVDDSAWPAYPDPADSGARWFGVRSLGHTGLSDFRRARVGSEIGGQFQVEFLAAHGFILASGNHPPVSRRTCGQSSPRAGR